MWQLGPDYDRTPEEKAIGWIIGQHHATLIPRGLPGEGNILVYDNGGWGGYGNPNPGAPHGVEAAQRDYSRVLEIDPVAMKIVWQYTPHEAELPYPARRLPFLQPLHQLRAASAPMATRSSAKVPTAACLK